MATKTTAAPTTRLRCLTEPDATAVITEWGQYGGKSNSVTFDPSDARVVLITYVDKRYPLDIADWAFNEDHVSDSDAAAVMAAL